MKRNSSFNILAINISWEALEKGLRLLFGLITGVLLATYLGPELLGIYSYAFSLVAIIAPIVGTSYDGFLLKDFIKEEQRPGIIFGSSLVLRLAGAFAGYLILFGFILLDASLSHQQIYLILIFGLAFFPRALNLFDVWFRSQLKTKYSAISFIVANVIVSTLKIGFILAKMPLEAFAWLFAIEFTLLLFLEMAAFFMMEKNTIKLWRISIHRIKFLLSESWPIMVSSLSFVLYERIDQVMIGNMLTNERVGVYSIAVKILDIPMAIMTVLIMSVYPLLTRKYNFNPIDFDRRYRQIVEVFTAVGYALFILMLFGADLLMKIFPPGFADAVSVLRINFFGVIFMLNSGMKNGYLTLKGRQKYILPATLTAAIVNIGLNFVMIPAYGINGAAWATVISIFISGIGFYALIPGLKNLFNMHLKALMLTTLLRKFQS